MRKSAFIPAALVVAFLLSVPTLGQAAHEQHGAPAGEAKAAPAVDPDKAYLLKQEFVAKTAELHGKIKAREAELETVLATKPGDEAAIKKLVAEISALRGQVFEQTTLFRLRYAKETGSPIRLTQHMGGHGGMMMDGMKGEGGMDCKMMGKGMAGMNHDGKGMDMDHSGKGMNMDHAGTGMPMDHGAMPAPAAPAAPAPKQ
ncbi:hypothetical protein [Desulfovibrio sp. TomC]|uniref:hypothetical protein n=1 Tax=Desulfovibrio sp. TomC TaxID=1562888 RepID=UPI0005734CDB|nr:hypothetical protein [Desulfovibrio sp. TomC]KHK00873.1 Zinc resistance-associated protein [Desulfovibrio sp. TomC]